MNLRNWRNACSLIIAARTKQNTSVFDYNLMMLKRSSKSSFMPTAYVYPGGVCEKTDFSPSWLDVFAQHGQKSENLLQQFVSRRTGPAPAMYKDVSSPSLLPEVGFRISAIRETFEETGILFCKSLDSGKKTSADVDVLKEWRLRVMKNPAEFETLCKNYNLCPDVWSLYEWSNWLTPVDVGPKRFDTMFYICVLPEQPTINVDNKEITNFACLFDDLERGYCVNLRRCSLIVKKALLKGTEKLQKGTVMWVDPVSSVKSHMKKEIWLAPPQLYEACRFARFTRLDELRDFVSKRQDLGTERWLPVRYNTSDGAISVLPGDSLYPDDPNLHEVRTEVLENETVENCRRKYPKLHRMEALSPLDFHILCNVQVACGQIQPLDLIRQLSEGDQQNQSKL